jgi:3-oxoacyl-[acyl-carrier-protein] synthase III
MSVGAAIASVAMAPSDRFVSNGRVRPRPARTGVGADFLSRFLDVSDRDTPPLFADGAGAAVVSATDSPIGRIGPILLRSDHSGWGPTVAGWTAPARRRAEAQPSVTPTV